MNDVEACPARIENILHLTRLVTRDHGLRDGVAYKGTPIVWGNYGVQGATSSADIVSVLDIGFGGVEGVFTKR